MECTFHFIPKYALEKISLISMASMFIILFVKKKNVLYHFTLVKYILLLSTTQSLSERTYKKPMLFYFGIYCILNCLS